MMIAMADNGGRGTKLAAKSVPDDPDFPGMGLYARHMYAIVEVLNRTQDHWDSFAGILPENILGETGRRSIASGFLELRNELEQILDHLMFARLPDDEWRRDTREAEAAGVVEYMPPQYLAEALKVLNRGRPADEGGER